MRGILVVVLVFVFGVVNVVLLDNEIVYGMF